MSLSLLYPLALLGVAAIAAPIWLHLRQKVQANVIRFSAVQFLENQPHVRRSPLRLRDILLLLLRLLAVLLLVAAFAWPYRAEPKQVAATESRVYLLDNTLSHQADGGLQRERDRLLEAVARAGPETQIAVIELTAQPRVVSSFGDSRETAADKIRSLEPSFQRGSYLSAFRQANTLLASSLGQTRRIVFSGDNQENQWTEHSAAPPFLEDVEVVLPDLREESAPNLALAGPRARRIVLADKSIVDFSVDLFHAGDAQSATVVVRANDREVFRGDVPLENEPETITLAGQWEAEPSQWLRGEASVEGEPDALAGDNRVFFAVPPVREGKVLLLAQSKYLRTALSPDIMRGRWATRVLDPTELAEAIKTGHDADVLCVESNYLQAADARNLLLRYLNNERGVLLLVNRTTPLVNGFLRELGIEPQPPAAGPTTASTFRYVFADHPIFHPFRAPDFGNLMDVKVSQYRRLRMPQAMPLVFSQTGDVLFCQGTQTKGKLFVLAFALDRADTNWPLHPTFIPFLDLCLQNARAADTMPTAFEPGELAVLNLPADTAAREVVLRDGDRELSRTPVLNNRVQLQIPDRPGLYGMSYDDDPTVERMLSVNPSPQESRLTYVDSHDAIAAWQLPPSGLPANDSPTITLADLTLANILQQRIWWWLLVAGLAALAAEMLWLYLAPGSIRRQDFRKGTTCASTQPSNVA